MMHLVLDRCNIRVHLMPNTIFARYVSTIIDLEVEVTANLDGADLEFIVTALVSDPNKIASRCHANSAFRVDHQLLFCKILL